MTLSVFKIIYLIMLVVVALWLKSFVSEHLYTVWPGAPDLWPLCLWLLCSSEHKDHSERKNRDKDKEKLRHSDGSSDKHKEKHKEKRREEKVCSQTVTLTLIDDIGCGYFMLSFVLTHHYPDVEYLMCFPFMSQTDFLSKSGRISFERIWNTF